MGCRFPKGIPVARVSKVDHRDFGNFQSVEAVPTVDFSRLEEVFIALIDTGECSPPALAKPRRSQR
jgi:cell shape-determining protein MreC